MAPSYKDQIRDLKHYMVAQEKVIVELKRDRDSAVHSLTALHKGTVLLMTKLGQWEELNTSEILDLSDMPDLATLNMQNYPLLADLSLQILAATIKTLSLADRELATISDELKIEVPEVPLTWSPGLSEIPSPLTRALTILETALEETPKWKSKRTSDISATAISEAETLIQAMESTLTLSRDYSAPLESQSVNVNGTSSFDPERVTEPGSSDDEQEPITPQKQHPTRLNPKSSTQAQTSGSKSQMKPSPSAKAPTKSKALHKRA